MASINYFLSKKSSTPITETYSEPGQISKVGGFTKIIDDIFIESENV